MRDVIFETERLYARQMCQDDYGALAAILGDDEAMVAYEGAFDDAGIQTWLASQVARYEKDGFGLWAIVLRESGEMIGQCGLTWQDICGRQVLEIGYLFRKSVWHKGYAIEAAKGCKAYAFGVLKAQEVYSIVRDTNIASMNVAIRNGMLVRERFIKHYRGIDMPHLAFSVRSGEAQQPAD